MVKIATVKRKGPSPAARPGQQRSVQNSAGPGAAAFQRPSSATSTEEPDF